MIYYIIIALLELQFTIIFYCISICIVYYISNIASYH